MKPTLLKTLLGATLAFTTLPAFAAATPEAVPAPQSAFPIPADQAIAGAVDNFYAVRGNALVWLKNGPASPAVTTLLSTLRRAPLDGLAAGPQLADDIQASLASATNPAAAIRADRLMSAAWLRYVAALHTPAAGMVYNDPRLTPRTPAAGYILEQAARASSLAEHIGVISSVNPMYAELRDAAWAQRQAGAPMSDPRLAASLDRLRDLPATGRFVLVNAATQQLSMVENGRVVGTMKVVVGRPDAQTPMVASTIWYATFNPYWNIPSDLGRKLIAPHVIKEGIGWLKKDGYEVIDDWNNPTVLAPSTIDWKGVIAGTTQVKMRERPSAANSMGKVKFNFNNPEGIYLHDTNNRILFTKDVRALSNGCIRLEEAGRLGRWLGSDMVAPSAEPELNVRLPQGTPVYVTYITARPEGGQIAFTNDVYSRDMRSNRVATR